MAPKGGNAKKESGRAKKAENEAKKKDAAAAEKEKQVASEWSEGAKSNKKKEEAEERRREQLAKKAEKARLLAEEEAAGPSKVKTAPKAGGKKKGIDTRPAGPGAIAAGGDIAGGSDSGSRRGSEPPTAPPEEPESFAATGIDNMLDLMDAVNTKTDKASVGQQAAGIERHPERRFKAAFEAYQERELPNIRGEHPGLRLQQYKDLLYKQFQKSPDNPFNQVLVAYDASKEEKVDALQRRNQEVQERLRDRS